MASQTLAAEYGAIKGRFIYKGEPKVEPIQPTKDTEYCGQHELKTETVKVSPKGELQNVFVYLYTPRGKKIEVNPEIKPAAEPKVLDNKGCRFEPHAMTLWTEEKLEIRNSDEGIGHNTNAQKLVANPKFNEQVTNGNPIVKEFSKSEPIPTEVACNVHPWMSAVVLIRDNPYMAVSGEDGSFTIEGVPAGKHAFVFWHEAKGNLRDLPVGKEKADRRGQVDLEVKAGETLDLGDIEVTPAILGQ
ncbi:MAG TPA: methylamine utilization protein [Lacipirellula sp.]